MIWQKSLKAGVRTGAPGGKELCRKQDARKHERGLVLLKTRLIYRKIL
jgi:hypothetical protein